LIVNAQIKVWDIWVRLFHWTMVGCFFIAYLNIEDAYELHVATGYVVLGLLIFRFAIGFFGSTHSRFGDFLYPPAQIIVHLKDLIHMKTSRYVGHNPAGGAMVLVLLCSLTVIVLSGIALDGAENRAGPLGATLIYRYKDFVEEIHEFATNFTLGLIALHVTGVAIQSALEGQNLTLAMITGNKSAAPSHTRHDDK